MILRIVAVFCVCLFSALPAASDVVLQQTAKMKWSKSDSWFGGWSGIEVTQAGKQLTVINDKGRLLSARLVRSGATLVGIDVTKVIRMRKPNGRLLKGVRSDAEGLAIGPDGAAYVSFERVHRVMRLDLQTGKTSPTAHHPNTSKFQVNAGFEALAVTARGTLLTLPEKSASRRTAFQLDALQNGTWRAAAHIPRRGPFLPVGADIDAQGRLWLLERATTALGFRSRIRLFDLGHQNPTFRTVLNSVPGQYDNLEGISVWQDAAGRTHVTLISDDNFLRVQQTQLVEFVVAN